MKYNISNLGNIIKQELGLRYPGFIDKIIECREIKASRESTLRTYTIRYNDLLRKGTFPNIDEYKQALEKLQICEFEDISIHSFLTFDNKMVLIFSNSSNTVVISSIKFHNTDSSLG